MTDSQKFLKEEEAKLLDWVEEEAARRKRREALDRARALPKFELAERQTIADAAVSGDGKFAFLVMNERAQSRASQVPRYVSESAFTEEINARTKVGDAQDRRRLAILNLETGEGVWAGLDGVSDPIAIPKPPSTASEPSAAGAQAGPSAPRQSATCDGDRRCCRPTAASRWYRCASADNTERWLATIDPATGTTKILDRIKDDAWVRDGGQGWLPDNKRVWFLAEHDGWMHLYTVDATTGPAQATDDRQVRDRFRRAVA